MAKILSQYVNLTDSSQKIEYASQKEYIEALSNNSKLSPMGDLERPYSFREWYSTRTNIIAGQEYVLYNQYLTDWYSSRKESSISTTIDTQEVYLNILNQLQTSFSDELLQQPLDLNDPGEIINRLPEYAKKIKDIARYFILKRESIKRAKLKYNMVGTNQAIECLLYEYLLKAFTKNEINNNNSISNLPELSASQNLQITIEELYDDNSYFDRDPQLPTSAYFINTDISSSFLTAYNINTQAEFDWLYSTGVSQLCADNPLLWVVDDVLAQYNDGLPLSAIEDATTEILNDYNRIKLTQKYLGEEQYIISGGYYDVSGTWMNITSGVIVDTVIPCANLTNRHFPTYASVPYIDNIYSTQESGGYMIPSNMGASIALTKNNKNVLARNTAYSSANIFQNILLYNTDNGLTLTSQNTPVSTIEVDSEWMKSLFTEGRRAGIIKSPIYYQEFIPYQSTYESIGRNRLGILQQQDTSSQYEDVCIALSGLTLDHWDSDVFGNQYGLYTGAVNMFWVRNVLQFSAPGDILFKDVFETIIPQYAAYFTGTHDNMTAAEFNSSILSFKVFFDTIIFEMADAIITVKILFDYETGSISADINDINVIKIEDNMKYVNHYFFPEDKLLTLGFLLYCDGLTETTKQIRPLLYSLDLESSNIMITYNKSSVDTDFDYTYITGIDIVDSAAITFDKLRLIYNVSFVYNDVTDGMYLFSFNIIKKQGIFDIYSVKVIEPI